LIKFSAAIIPTQASITIVEISLDHSINKIFCDIYGFKGNENLAG